MSDSNCIGLAQDFHYKLVVDELIKVFTDFCTEACELLAMMELTNAIEDVIPDESIITINVVPKAITEQYLSRLLIDVRDLEGFNIFNWSKKNMT